MGTINDKIEYLNETKSLIKQAIINKGQSIQENDTFRSYAEKIQNITTGIDTSDADALAQDILIDKTAYVNNIKITGTMSNQGELTITPSISEQQKEAGYYSNILIKAVTNEIDSNIVAENIKQGITILGIAGTYKGLDTNSATATADNIMLNQTAYVKGELITGNMEQQAIGICIDDVTATLLSESNEVEVKGRWNGSKVTYIDNTCTLGAKINYTTLANIIGLTADKIKSGETILGIQGTYTGEPA